MSNIMTYKTKDQRDKLAIYCTTSYFQMFMDQSCRGPNWNPECMPRLIKTAIETQAFLFNIPEKYFEEMFACGMDFYNLYFKNLIETR